MDSDFKKIGNVSNQQFIEIERKRNKTYYVIWICVIDNTVFKAGKKKKKNSKIPIQ